MRRYNRLMFRISIGDEYRLTHYFIFPALNFQQYDIIFYFVKSRTPGSQQQASGICRTLAAATGFAAAGLHGLAAGPGAGRGGGTAAAERYHAGI